MEPITTALTTAKEIYEAGKTIQKVYTVSHEMKTVAESEGKDQIVASKELAGTAIEMKQDNASEKSQTKIKDLKLTGDLYNGDLYESTNGVKDITPVFVDPLKPGDGFSQGVEFVDKLPNEGQLNPLEDTSEIFIDGGQYSDANDSQVRFVNSNDIKNDDCSLEETKDEGPRRIKTINDGLVGQKHPETGVPYVEKEVITENGEKVIGVFPQFESMADVQLPEELCQASDRAQFSECNRQLKESLEKDPELRNKFTKDQLADIEEGNTPEGYTWHHNEEKGKMQLVDSDVHSQTRHTGGRNIWGGGTENRH